MAMCEGPVATVSVGQHPHRQGCPRDSVAVLLEDLKSQDQDQIQGQSQDQDQGQDQGQSQGEDQDQGQGQGQSQDQDQIQGQSQGVDQDQSHGQIQGQVKLEEHTSEAPRHTSAPASLELIHPADTQTGSSQNPASLRGDQALSPSLALEPLSPPQELTEGAPGEGDSEGPSPVDLLRVVKHKPSAIVFSDPIGEDSSSADDEEENDGAEDDEDDDDDDDAFPELLRYKEFLVSRRRRNLSRNRKWLRKRPEVPPAAARIGLSSTDRLGPASNEEGPELREKQVRLRYS